MAQLRKISQGKNDASSLGEVDLKEIVPKKLDFFIDNKENKVFKDLKDKTYFKNLKRDIEENQGIENPVICFKDGTLVEGHSRIQVLRELVKEGKLPKTYNVPTIIFKGTKEEGTKRLILGNLNRFEIPFPTKIKLWKDLGYFGGDDTVSPPFTNKELSGMLNLSERQVQRVKAILREVEEMKGDDTVSPPDEEELYKEAIRKQNEERKSKTGNKNPKGDDTVSPPDEESTTLKTHSSTKESQKETPSSGAKEPSKKQVNPVISKVLKSYEPLKAPGKNEIFRFPENEFSPKAKEIYKTRKLKEGRTPDTKEKNLGEFKDYHLENCLKNLEAYFQVFGSIQREKYLLESIEEYLERRGWKK